MVNATQTSLQTGSGSHLFAAGTVWQTTSLPDFLSRWNFHSPSLTGFAPGFTPAAGMCPSTAQSEGLRWERSGQPGAQRGAGWAVESYSPELLQGLPRSLGNVIPARQSPCGKGWVLFFRVLLSFEEKREFRVIYPVSLLEEICFNPPNLILLLRVPGTANIGVLSVFLHWKLSLSQAW